MHNVSQWLNLRHLGESLGGAEGLLEAVSFKKVTKGMGRGSVVNARWETHPLVECHFQRPTTNSVNCETSLLAFIVSLSL